MNEKSFEYYLFLMLVSSFQPAVHHMQDLLSLQSISSIRAFPCPLDGFVQLQHEKAVEPNFAF